MHPDATPSTPRQRQIALFIILAGVVCMGMGQTIVFAVLPPIAREIGMGDLQVLSIFMLSAFFWVVIGPLWGRQSDIYGRRPFIVIGLSGFAISMTAFATVVHFGLAGALSGVLLYGMLLGTRSIYGVIGCATPGAAQAYIAHRMRDSGIDLLVNNAGIMGALPFAENLHRQHFGSIDYGLWQEVFTTNTLGTVKMTEAFVEHVARSDRRTIVTLSSTTGSISESPREALAYTTSKAALNKAMTLIAARLRPRGVIMSLLCHGYVKTRMNVGGATVEVNESVSAMRRLIEDLTLQDSGTFRRYNGDVIAW